MAVGGRCLAIGGVALLAVTLTVTLYGTDALRDTNSRPLGPMRPQPLPSMSAQLIKGDLVREMDELCALREFRMRGPKKSGTTWTEYMLETLMYQVCANESRHCLTTGTARDDPEEGSVTLAVPTHGSCAIHFTMQGKHSWLIQDVNLRKPPRPAGPRPDAGARGPAGFSGNRPGRPSGGHRSAGPNHARLPDRAPPLPPVLAVVPVGRFGVGEQVKTVWTMRDPRDMAVSMYYWAKSRPAEDLPGKESLARFVLFNFGAYVRRMASEWPVAVSASPCQYFVLQYEAMQLDPRREMRALVDFLTLGGMSDAELDSVIARTSFDEMRRMELNGTLREPVGGYGKLDVDLKQAMATNITESPAKTREGKIGGFVDHVSPAVAQWMLACMRRAWPADLFSLYSDVAPNWTNRSLTIAAYRTGRRLFQPRTIAELVTEARQAAAMGDPCFEIPPVAEMGSRDPSLTNQLTS